MSIKHSSTTFTALYELNIFFNLIWVLSVCLFYSCELIGLLLKGSFKNCIEILILCDWYFLCVVITILSFFKWRLHLFHRFFLYLFRWFDSLIIFVSWLIILNVLIRIWCLFYFYLFHWLRSNAVLLRNIWWSSFSTHSCSVHFLLQKMETFLCRIYLTFCHIVFDIEVSILIRERFHNILWRLYTFIRCGYFILCIV